MQTGRWSSAREGRSSTALVVLLVVVLLGLVVVLPRNVVESVLVAVGFERGPPERHVVPVGHEGWLVVHYGVADRPALPVEDGATVLRFPESGLLETSTPWETGIKRKLYFLETPDGLLPLTRSGLDRRIWKERDVSLGTEDDQAPAERFSAFFVGTREASREADSAWLEGVLLRGDPFALPGGETTAGQ